MKGYNNIVGFARVLDKTESTIRYIDITSNTLENGYIKDPYFFNYENITNSKGTAYSLPSEGYNYPEALEEVVKLSDLSTKDELLYFSNAFLPQLDPVQDTLNLTRVGSFASVRTQEGYYFNIYLTLLPGESIIEFYSPSKDNKDPYGLTNSSNVTLLQTTDILEPEDKLKAVILGVNISDEVWNWKSPVVQSVKRPIYWVDRSDKENVNKLPSKFEYFDKYLNDDEGYARWYDLGDDVYDPVWDQWYFPANLEIGTRRFRLESTPTLLEGLGGPIEQ